MIKRLSHGEKEAGSAIVKCQVLLSIQYKASFVGHLLECRCVTPWRDVRTTSITVYSTVL